ncbi:glycosyltransferase [Psychrobacter sp. Pi2-51]|uniref:glycosyltransferase n=1 Tax=Psychrobacter sp. Pi2-51 TaxID=2774132 RepID=UPI001917DCC9|nr:glycosyltransferase [Psychrobacter sp. Pi2-51]
MKILFIITGLGMGGAEHVVVNLADALVARGHEVKIAYLTGEALVLPSNPDIEVVFLCMVNGKDAFRACIKVRALVKKMQPDVVHSHMFHSNLLARLLRLTINIPTLICTSHSKDEGGRLRMLAYLLTDKLADISTNVSQDAVDSLVAKGATTTNRMVSVPNGVDTNKFFFNNVVRILTRNELKIDNVNIILAVGRMHKAKDYPNLLNAIASLKVMRQDFKVLIVGDGPLKEEVTSLAERLGITDVISFLGIRRDIPALMSASDVFTLSSAWEGFGLVVAEAMACERVVVATNCGGVNEVIGSKGFLVEPKNSELLAVELNKALNLNIAERFELGIAARKRIIDNYSLEANVEAYLELYNS